MTRTRLTRAESKARTRAMLLDAARQVFLERGYHRTSLEAVAEEAGFSIGAVYSAFASKADLFFAVFDLRVEERTRQMEEIGAGAASAVEQGEELARQFVAVTKHDPHWSLLIVEFWAHAARDPELRRRFALRHDALKQAVAGVIEKMLARTGQRLGLELEHLAMTAIALGNGFTLERLTHPDGVPDELFPRLSALIMNALIQDEQS
jgi:AcrR family transcriptional regulator